MPTDVPRPDAASTGGELTDDAVATSGAPADGASVRVPSVAADGAPTDGAAVEDDAATSGELAGGESIRVPSAAAGGGPADGVAGGDADSASAGVASDALSPALRALVDGWDTDIEALLGELRLANDVRFDVPMPRTLSATRLLSYAADPDGFAEELFRPMPRPPAPQARRGTEFHAWVEHRFGQQSLFDDEELDLLAEEDIEGEEDLTELKSAFLRTPYADRQPHRVEAPFQLRLGSHIIRGRIDAVYVDDDGTYEVVDWKTNRYADADPLQLAVYRLAWAELVCVPIDDVRAAFVYVRTGQVHRPGDLPDRAALEQLLAG